MEIREIKLGDKEEFVKLLYQADEETNLMLYELDERKLTVTKNSAGLALYKKTGFEKEGIKRDSLFIDGRFVNKYYMYKILSTKQIGKKE